jgi:thiamine pyrophosphokinase
MREWVLLGPLGPNLDPKLQAHGVIAVDGGANFSRKIDLWVGDADSIQGPLPNGPRVELPKNKNRSDLAHALLQVPDSVSVLHLWGFLGKRRDHEWFNLGEVSRWLSLRTSVRAQFYNEQGTVSVIALTRGELQVQGLFSLASIESNRVTLTGECEYSLHEPTELLPLSSLGLSNRGCGLIQINAERPVILFFETE